MTISQIFRFQTLFLIPIFFLISCNSNKFSNKELSYIKWVEDGGYYFLDLKINKDGSVKGKSGYYCCSTYSVDSWDGVINGTLIKDSISGTYKYQEEGKDYNEPVIIKLYDDYAVFTEKDEADIVLNLETPERLKAHPRELQKADKNKITIAFENWKKTQIKEKKLLITCPIAGSPDFQTLLDNYTEVNRWAYKKTIKTLYVDFNQDNIEDAIVIYEREDCVHGNGYVGDYQVPLIFLSNHNNYFIDNGIINIIKNELNRNAIGYFVKNVAYIEVENTSNTKISGIYYDWKEGDPSGNPSVKKSFDYYFLTKKIDLNETGTESEHFYKKGLDKSEMGDYKGAIKEFTQAINLNPNFFDAINERADANYFSDDFNGALKDYNKSIELDQDKGNYLFRGNVKSELKDFAGAILDYKKSLAMGVGTGATYARIGEAEIQLKQNKAACLSFQKALEAGYSPVNELIEKYCK